MTCTRNPNLGYVMHNITLKQSKQLSLLIMKANIPSVNSGNYPNIMHTFRYLCVALKVSKCAIGK